MGERKGKKEPVVATTGKGGSPQWYESVGAREVTQLKTDFSTHPIQMKNQALIAHHRQHPLLMIQECATVWTSCSECKVFQCFFLF